MEGESEGKGKKLHSSQGEEKKKKKKHSEGNNNGAEWKIKNDLGTNGTSTMHQMVKLNVGGTRFMTTRSTIFSKGENFLTVMLDNKDKFEVNLDEEGYIFIDRSGDVFKVILEYLRTGKMIRPQDTVTVEQLAIELDFFQITFPQDKHDSCLRYSSSRSSCLISNK
eukprot:TRINITY_DN4461_c0_g2_i1.p1 TRINITY_DN4461_c0_g2~~TRINITY_DN4461_c0_g2_i1.p1  ORF type:complete len:166 (+),score=34.73 TRINITY_DN4461_c0_g2_i1:17-514(+)